MRTDNPPSNPVNLVVLTLVIALLAAGAFFFGRTTGNGAAIANAPTASAEPMEEAATMPPTITRVPTSTPRPTLTPVPTATPIPSPTPIIITEAAVLSRIQRTSSLQTVMFKFDTVVRAEKKGSPFFNWGGQRVIVFVKGTVRAGVDLSKLKSVKIDQTKRTIHLELPPPEILGVDMDDPRIENYDGSIPGNVDPALRQGAYEQGRSQIFASACESDILGIAGKEAVATFERLLNMLDLADYSPSVGIPSGPCLMPAG